MMVVRGEAPAPFAELRETCLVAGPGSTAEGGSSGRRRSRLRGQRATRAPTEGPEAAPKAPPHKERCNEEVLHARGSRRGAGFDVRSGWVGAGGHLARVAGRWGV